MVNRLKFQTGTLPPGWIPRAALGGDNIRLCGVFLRLGEVLIDAAEVFAE
jgi:hypothetical protein